MPVMKVGPGRALLYSGIVAWDPSQPTAGGYLPEHWYRSDSGLWQDAGVTPAVLDGDVVGRWEDLTANADHVNSLVAANKPTLQNAVGDLLNNSPIILFDGINDGMTGPFTTGGSLTQPDIMFAVIKLDASDVGDAAFHTMITGDDILTYHSLGQNNANNWYTYAGASNVGGASDANWNIWTSLFNGVTSQLWLNGISEAGPGNAGANQIDGLAIGGRIFGADQYCLMSCTEIILYDADLSNADKNQVGNYLATRYGLAYTDI